MFSNTLSVLSPKANQLSRYQTTTMKVSDPEEDDFNPWWLRWLF